MTRAEWSLLLVVCAGWFAAGLYLGARICERVCTQ